MNVVYPKRTGGRWYFEGPEIDSLPYYFNLLGMNDILERVASEIPDSENGFKFSFSDTEFPGHSFTLDRGEKHERGYWYFSPALKLMGYLGPETIGVFQNFPIRIYLKHEKLDS